MQPYSELAHALEQSGAGFILPVQEAVEAHGRYHAVCRDADGNIKWEDDIENLVTTVGKNFALDTTFAGSAYTAAWFMGLVDGGSAPAYNVADTMASHAGWTENVGYSNATRPAPAFSSAAAGTKATSTGVVFTINATGTIAGAFMNTVSTKSGTTGTLYSAGSFTGGNKSVANGDSLTITYSASLT